MFYSKKAFNFLNSLVGVTKDGEKYVSVSVVDPDTDIKYSFFSKDEEVIGKIKQLQIPKYSEITLFLGFEREFNTKTRFSNWKVSLVGVE